MPKPFSTTSSPVRSSQQKLPWIVVTLGCVLVFLASSTGVVSQETETSDETPAPVAKAPGEFGVEGFDSTSEDVVDPTLIEDQKMTEEEEKALKVELQLKNVKSKLRAGESYAKHKELIQKSIEYGVYRLTMVSHRNELSKISGSFLRDIRNAAFLQNKPSLAESFRKAYLTDVTAKLIELLDGNFNVRMQAVVLLTELNLIEANAAKRREAVAFIPVKTPLMDVLKDKKQKTALKVVAVNGLRRILETADPKTTDKVDIAVALASEIQNAKTHPWYQMRLAETLGTIGIVRDNRNQPLIVKTLVDVLMDVERPWIVRATAARALGRAEYDTKINVSLVSYEIVKFASEYAVHLKQNPLDVNSHKCTWRIYTAFQPANAQERTEGAGLLARVGGNTFAAHRAKVEGAYKTILPLASLVLNTPARVAVSVPQSTIDQLDAWTQKNRPADLKLDPNLAPLAGPDQQQASTATADASR